MGIANPIRRSRPRAVTDFTLDLPNNLFHFLCRLQLDYGIQVYVNLRFSSKQLLLVFALA